MVKSFLVTVTNDLNQDQRMHRICKSLIGEGHTVLLVGRKKSNSQVLLDQPFDQKRLNCFFSKGFLFYIEYNIRIFILALNMKPGVIYSVDLDTLLGCGIAAIFLKNKLVHDAHEYFVEVPELQGKRLKKRIWNSIGKQFIPGADLCLTVNQELANILSEKYNNTFHVIRSVPPLNPDYKRTTKSNVIPVVLYQGVLNEGRGLEAAINAISNLNEKAILKIAGEGDLSNKLRSLVEELMVRDRVKFLGWLSPDELKLETLNADVGLNLLSSTSLNYKYSLANKFFDYMHAGVPSINMNFPVYLRICEEFEVGLCINSLDQNKIQSALTVLLNDQEIRNRMVKSCETARAKYNWENESSGLIDLVNTILLDKS